MWESGTERSPKPTGINVRSFNRNLTKYTIRLSVVVVIASSSVDVSEKWDVNGAIIRLLYHIVLLIWCAFVPLGLKKKLFNVVAHSSSLSVLVTTIKCTQQPIWLLFLWHDFTLKNNPLIWTFKCAITTENQWTLWWEYDVMWCDHLVLAVRLAVLPYTILSFSYSHTLALSVMRAMHTSNIKKSFVRFVFCGLTLNRSRTYTYAHVSDVGSLYDSISNLSW